MSTGDWTYWVSFAHHGGFGGLPVTSAEPITTAAEVRSLHRQIAESGVVDPVVLSWQLLSGPAEAPAVDTAVSVQAADVDQPELSAERLAMVEGLRELASLLGAHPEVPAPAAVSVYWYAPWEDEPGGMAKAEAVEHIRAAAAALGVDVDDSSTGNRVAVDASFGPVRYSAVYLSAAVRAQAAARQAAADPVGVPVTATEPAPGVAGSDVPSAAPAAVSGGTVRSDAELLAVLADRAGPLDVRAAARELGCGIGRARRLLAQAGLLPQNVDEAEDR